MRLSGQVALVTGGAKRIGRSIALSLAEQGCRVAITYRSSVAEADRTLQEIRRRKAKGLALQADQRRPEQVQESVRSVVRRFGRIDLLVNNASSFYPTPFGRVSETQWADLLEANLSGPWRYAQAVGSLMKRRGSGQIINILDAAVFSPWTDYLPYCAAKGGLLTLTKGLAKALAPQVQVNAIAPGPILSPSGLPRQAKKQAVRRTLLKRWGNPSEIAQAVLFLAGSDFVTGVVVPVDGGRLLA